MWTFTGVAHINNPISQENIVEEQALPILVNLLKHHNSLQIKVHNNMGGCVGMGVWYRVLIMTEFSENSSWPSLGR